MGFLAPGFLAGLAALALPLWLHLLRRYRDQPRPFSSLMFFEPRTQSSILHRRLRHWLLLALRLALLALLALAFANPFVTAPPTATNRDRLLVLAIDRSLSMRYGDHLEQAKRFAREALRGAAGGMAVVASFDTGVEFLAGPTNDRASLDSAISSIQAGDGGTSFGALARALRGLAASQHRALDMRLFSDLQRTALPPSFADLDLPAGARLTAKQTGAGNEANWTVANVDAPARVFDAGKKRVAAVVAGYNTPAATMTASLVLDGRVLESKSVAVAANGRATVEFQSLETPYGFHRGEVRIAADDLLREDNRFPFAVERSEPRPVLFLSSEGRSKAALYFRTALGASGDSGFTLEEKPAIGFSPADVSSYAFVVLSDAGDLPAPLASALSAYVRRGGAVLAVLGPSSLRTGRTPIVGRVVRGATSPGRGETYQTASVTEPGHAALRGLNLQGVKFYQAMFTEAADARVIARLDDHSPLLFEDKVGSGKVLTLTSALDNTANDFPLRASFVPFVEQTANYLGGTAGSTANLTTGSIIDLHGEGEEGAAVDVTGPDGKRALSLSEAASLRSFELLHDGFYEIRAPNGRHRLVAVHTDGRESDLTVVPAETLALWTPAAGGDAPTAPPPDRAREPRREALGHYVLILALLAALAESVLSVRYLWEKEAA